MTTWRMMGLAGLLFLSAAPAWAGHKPPGAAPKGFGAPEIDPSALGSAAALVAGGTMLVAPRRRRRLDANR
jgi:hypothetical protein